MSDKNPMNVKGIVEQFLIGCRFDGLCNPDQQCGCYLGDLFPCGEYFANCEPGYRRIKDETCQCEFTENCEDFCICKNKKVDLGKEIETFLSGGGKH